MQFKNLEKADRNEIIFYFCFCRWRKWWSGQGIITCSLSCCIQTQVTWLNRRTCRMLEAEPTEHLTHMREVSSPSTWGTVDGNRIWNWLICGLEAKIRTLDLLSVSCCLCNEGSVGRRDSGTFSGSGGRLEEDAGLSEGESVWQHKPWCTLIVPSVTKETNNNYTEWKVQEVKVSFNFHQTILHAHSFS